MTYGGVTEEGFIINPQSGVITTTKELDAELENHYTLTGTAELSNTLHYLTVHILIKLKFIDSTENPKC